MHVLAQLVTTSVQACLMRLKCRPPEITRSLRMELLGHHEMQSENPQPRIRLRA